MENPAELPTRVLRLTLVDDESGELIASWVTSELLSDVKAAIEDGSRFGLSVYESRKAHDEAAEDE